MFIPSSLIRKKKIISKNKEKVLNNKKSNLVHQINLIQKGNSKIEDTVSPISSTVSTKSNILPEEEQKQDIKNSTENVLMVQSIEYLEKSVENEITGKSPILVEGKLTGEEEEEEGEEQGDEDKVKEFSFQQRWPLDDEEPICVICGRYGEYICDETDHDVCSMECKKLDIENANNANVNGGIGESSVSTEDKTPTDIPLIVHKISFPIQKILFNELLLSSMSIEEFKKKYKTIEIKVVGDLVNEGISNPISNFESLGLNSQLFRNLKKYRYSKPTTVQTVTIPSLLKGHDMLVKSPMKSGKTMAYLLPLILHCINMTQCFLGLDGISSNYNDEINSNLGK